MKRTFIIVNHKKRKKHGFRDRMASVNGKRILAKRRAKGRVVLSDDTGPKPSRPRSEKRN